MRGIPKTGLTTVAKVAAPPIAAALILVAPFTAVKAGSPKNQKKKFEYKMLFDLIVINHNSHSWPQFLQTVMVVKVINRRY
jgi:hypothetical protein